MAPMAARSPTLAFALAAFIGPVARAAAITPVQQVVQMLQEMKTKGISAVEVEKKVMGEYTKWANGRITDLGFEIKTATSDSSRLTAFIEKTDSTVESLGASIADLDRQISQLEGDQQASTNQRDSENAEFVKSQQDYSESVDALASAIQTLKAQSYDLPQADALLQKMAVKVPGMRRVLAALQVEQGKDAGAPAVAAYEFQSGGVIALLEKLYDKFRGELSDVEKAEANSAHAHNLEMLHLGNTIKRLNSDREEKASRKGQETAESAAAKGELSSTKADLAEDKKVLADTQSTLAIKQQAFQGNQEVRAQEIEAISKAIEIISDPSVSQSYSKHIKFVQKDAKPVSPHAAMLLQEGSQSASQRAAAKSRAAELLRERAQALSSKLLAKTAAGVAENPFGKVIEMIKSLLARLKEESASEADHKQWCDQELNSNKLRREGATTSVELLAAKVQGLDADIQTMGDDIHTLTEEQAELAKATAEATTSRHDEKAKNEAAIADAVAAQKALTKALVILREFYSNQEAPELIQQKKQVPEMKAYKGMQGAKGGVVGMLEVIQSDFARLETDTRATEAQNAHLYTEFMTDSKASTKQKHEREVKLRLDKDQSEFERHRTNDDLTAAEKELGAANTYYDNLKPPCLIVHVSYEERVQRRKDEIQALKDAYQVLDSKSA